MQNASILIVEDEVIIAYDLQQKLQTLGYQVPDICTSGEEAIESTNKHLPDLILMDIRLHGNMSGIEAVEQIQKQHDMPIIYLTAHTDTSTLEKAKHTRPEGYLVKPIDDEQSIYGPIEIALHKHQMETILKERESWFASTLQSIEDAVITIDHLGNITVMNPKAQMMTGYSKSPSPEQSIDEIIPLSLNKKSIYISRWMQETIKTGQSINLPDNTLLHNLNGTVFNIEGTITPIFSPKNEVLGAVFSFRNITERKKMEDRLRMTQYSLNHVGEGAFWIRKDATFAAVNETACKMLAYTRERLLQKTIVDIDSNLSLKRWNLYWETLKEKQHHIFETTLFTRDGRKLPVEIIGNYLEYNEVEYNFAIVRDITERIINIKALQESKRKLSLFARNFRGIAYQVQAKGEHEYIISHLEGDLERITGYPSELFHSGEMHWNQLIHPDDLDKVLSEDKKMITISDYTADNEYRIIKKDKSIRWVRDIARIIETEKNLIYQGSIFDITERVQAEQALRESEEKYRSLVELASDGILIVHQGWIRFANNRLISMFDLPASKVLNTRWLDHVIPEDKSIVTKYFKNQMHNKEITETFEIQIYLRNNQILPVEISMGHIPFHEEKAYLVFVRDIRERKKAELAMQQAQRTYHLASLGTLAAGISHEINQPLTALKVKVDGLLYWGKENPDILQRNLKSNLHFISEQAEEINKIIKHMRSLIYQEKGPLTKIHINQVIQKACRFVEQRLSSHGIVLNLRLTPRDPSVLAIETPLEQIVLNLITNALNALNRTDLNEKIIEIQTQRRHGYCFIHVRDNGPGIPEDNMNRIFDPLFTTEKNGKGMGLGLAIVEELLRQFKGSIKAKNQTTGGAQMTVQIPLINE
ncbi:PAS domain S-box protein [bacterium]|nr:PAS domain S-box protein [bacterium]